MRAKRAGKIFYIFIEMDCVESITMILKYILNGEKDQRSYKILCCLNVYSSDMICYSL